MTDIAFLGAGTMGLPMARNLTPFGGRGGAASGPSSCPRLLARTANPL